MARRLILVNRYFYPDQSATGQMLSDLAFYLSAQNERVMAIAGRGSYCGLEQSLPISENVQGVEVNRIWSTQWSRAGFLGRLVDDVTFYFSAAFSLWRLARKDDLVVVKTDPPMLPVIVGWMGRLRGFTTVNWLQDIYPEVAAALGVRIAKGAFGRTLARLRNVALHRAGANVVIGEDMAHRLVSLGVENKSIKIVHNWSDDETITPKTSMGNALRAEWGLTGKFVVGYSGNLGRAHEYETLLGAAEQLQSHPHISFLFVAGGHEIDALQREVERRGLSGFTFKPYQPRELLNHSLCVPDVHWLSLRSGLDGFLLPSKFYGIAAAGRPVIAVTSPASEFGRMIVKAKCGYVVVPGDSKTFASLVLELAGNEEMRMTTGRIARDHLERNYSKVSSLGKWHGLLGSL